jgi:hypothetical protein
MWRRRLRAKEGSQLISGQFSVPNKERKRTGLKTLRAAGRRPLQLQERGRDPTERVSAQDFPGDGMFYWESWVDLEV